MYVCYYYPIDVMWIYPYYQYPMINNYYFYDINVHHNMIDSNFKSKNPSNPKITINENSNNSFPIIPSWNNIHKSDAFMKKQKYIENVFAHAADKSVFPESEEWYKIFAPVLMICMNIRASYEYTKPTSIDFIDDVTSRYITEDIKPLIREIIDNEESFDAFEFMNIHEIVSNVLKTEFIYNTSEKRPNHYKNYFRDNH